MIHVLLLTTRDIEVLYDLFVRFNRKTAVASGWATTKKDFSDLMAVSLELIQKCEPILVHKQKDDLIPEVIKPLILNSQSINTIKSIMTDIHFNTYISKQYSPQVAPKIIEHSLNLVLKIEGSIISNEMNAQ